MKLNSNALKLIAIVAMAIDHTADLLFPGFPCEALPIAMHIIGRITAPVMWFFIAEGFYYTRNLKKYLLRMGAFALISHFAYCFCFGISIIPFREGIFNQTSIMWPLFWSLAALWVFHGRNDLKMWQKNLIFLFILVITFPGDYSCIAVLAVLLIYENRQDKKKCVFGMLLLILIYALVSFFFVDRMYALIQMGAILVCPLIYAYNGEKGKSKWMKWFFYIFYPAHMILIGLLRIIIHGNINLLF